MLAEITLHESIMKTTSECPLIGNGDSVIIIMRGMNFIFHTIRVEPR